MITDLRSDTFTKPSPAMLEAMFKVEVGDDVFVRRPFRKQIRGYGGRNVWNTVSPFLRWRNHG